MTTTPSQTIPNEDYLSPARHTDPIAHCNATEQISKRNRGAMTSGSKRLKVSHMSYSEVSKQLFANNCCGNEDSENTSPNEWREQRHHDYDDEDDLDGIDSRRINKYYATVLGTIRKRNNAEDDEELLFSARGKLFEFMKDEDRWVERGTGTLKFLRHLEEGITYGTVRLTMIHEGTMRRLFSHLVSPEVTVRSMRNSKKRLSYVWAPFDEERNCMRMFAVRFGNDHDTVEWNKAFEDAKTRTRRAQLGLDVPDTSVGDEVGEVFKVLSTNCGDVDEEEKECDDTATLVDEVSDSSGECKGNILSRSATL
mmetsp:Transcript_31915/g.39118  ORF Transcript_31915/g.39118 Transcript_31915/m.39118 type:complete len:310 (-) Transcript_31915:155-1084(-)|eukprot:CAMPEP_0172496528 /NCGR_PEP_ID=MMETSP1066-20121228/88708_1 /TAXON_ID=671091 /ORGANISM="Coscinodiscus wailesii, Strain CCMP2513" /LENGTH=309 /DNA_ID=CAMNT_0013268865 /DNA_START=64 /DNA_END=993 /DNA_ORIENTATION=+